MEIFASKITLKFSIQQISRIINKPYPLVYNSIRDLIDNNFIIKDRHSLLSLNYNANHSDIAYIESLRKQEFLKKNKTIDLFVKDVLNAIKLNYFTLLIFGSWAGNKQRKKSDVDVLLIVENKNDINKVEKILGNISSNFRLHFHCNVISSDSAYEMLGKRDKVNVINETLDNHILIFGAENYYRLLKNAR